jgi:hypothetical protein
MRIALDAMGGEGRLTIAVRAVALKEYPKIEKSF